MDEPTAIADNTIPDPFLLEETMTPVPEKFIERLTLLETNQRWHWWVVAGLGGWLVTISGLLFYMNGDLRAIRQKVSDNGFGNIVSQIQSPASSKQLLAALDVISSQIKYRQAEGAKPDPEKLAKLSVAVRAAALKSPDVAAVWQTGAQLINYRSVASATLPLPLAVDCLNPGNENSIDQLRATKDDAVKRGVTLNFADCTLNLDEKADYSGTLAGRFFAEARKRNPANPDVLVLTHGTVIYSGGPMIPLNKIVFVDCIFQIAAPTSIPPKAGQFLTDQLLIASDLNKAVVGLPSL